MKKSISLLFAYRDRDHSRVFHSMKSLEKQTDKDFHVIFVDYGSSEKNSQAILNTLSEFNFVDYHYVAHPGLLWNKSKAFNYGIWKSKSDYIITADIDLIFHPEFVASARKLASSETFTVFSYAYLQEKDNPEANKEIHYSELKPSHIGYITGSGLYPKVALEKIHGFDEFYHFYGSEDEDLFLRLEHSGLAKKDEKRNMLAHQWHPRYPFEEKNELSLVPKINNIRRINMEHYKRTKEDGKVIPDNQVKWGQCLDMDELLELREPEKVYKLECRQSAVIHFLHEYLPNIKGIIEVQFSENKETSDLKNTIKRLVGKKEEPVLSLKEVNDEVLKMILFRYRHYNYEYKIHENLKSLILRINLG